MLHFLLACCSLFPDPASGERGAWDHGVGAGNRGCSAREGLRLPRHQGHQLPLPDDRPDSPASPRLRPCRDLRPWSVLTEVAGSPLYISPEVIQRCVTARRPTCGAQASSSTSCSAGATRSTGTRYGSAQGCDRGREGGGRRLWEGPLWTSVSDATKALAAVDAEEEPSGRALTPAQLLEQLKALLASPDLAQEGA